MELPTNTTTATTSAGMQRVLGTYRSPDGEREIVAQRINGRVALSDIPADDHGRVYLIERHLPSNAELEGLVAAYLEHAKQLNGGCPMEDRLI